MTLVKCDYCGKEFEKATCYIKRTKQNFCCVDCKNKSFYTNKYTVFNEYSVLTITKKDNKEILFLIDTQDIKKLKQYHWRVRYTKAIDNYYADANKNKDRIILHRLIMDCPSNKVVDHINHNTLDNRKCNLRICTQYENLLNKKTFKNNKLNQKNISLKSNKYYVRFNRNKKLINLGSFNNLNDAIKIRDNFLGNNKCS